MSDQSGQPTILVKKADGTEVRMTMDEFRAYRSGKQESRVKPPAAAMRQEESNAGIGAAPKMLATAQATGKPIAPPAVHKAPEPPVNLPIVAAPAVTPTPTSSVVEKKTVQWNGDDHSSPLEEVSLPRVPTPKKAAGPEDRVSDALQRVSFAIKDSVRGRLQSLLVSRAKNIGTNEQVTEYLVRPEANGGVGLTQEEAMEALAMVNALLPRDRDEVKRMKTESKSSAPAPVRSMSPKPVAAVTQAPAPKPVASAPSVGSGERSMRSPQKVLVRDVIPPVPSVRPAITPTPAPVASPVPESTGPMDEFRRLSLTDFRRLGAPTVAADTLTSKFEILKKESYVAWLDGKDAFFQSPVFHLYRDVVVRGIRQGDPLDVSLASASGDRLSMEEWKAILHVGTYLNA